MIWLLVIAVIAGGAYVALRKPPAAPEPEYLPAPGMSIKDRPVSARTSHTTGSSDYGAIRARLAGSGLLQHLRYAPAGDMTAAGHVSAPGDILVTIRDRERDNRRRSVLLSNAARGDEVKGFFVYDIGTTGSGVSRHTVSVGTASYSWEFGKDLPEALAIRKCYINPVNLSSYFHRGVTTIKVVEFCTDMASCLGIESDQFLILSTGAQLVRAEQALTRRRTIWRDIISPALPTLITSVTAMAGAVGGAAGSPIAAALTGFCSRAMTVALTMTDRRAGLAAKISSWMSALATVPDAVEQLGSYAVQTGLNFSRFDPIIAARVSAAVEVVKGYGPGREIGMVLIKTDAQLQALKHMAGVSNAPYRVEEVVVYT